MVAPVTGFNSLWGKVEQRFAVLFNYSTVNTDCQPPEKRQSLSKKPPQSGGAAHGAALQKNPPLRVGTGRGHAQRQFLIFNCSFLIK